MTADHAEITRSDCPAAAATRAATVVAPTLREAANAAALIDRLAAVRAAAGLDLDLVLVDDDSGDGIEAAVAASGRNWVRLIVRRSEDGSGLASAALLGASEATCETVVVMDADLSHPPERIPDLLRALDGGADIALGSRFVPGGSTDAAWTLSRRINSALATLLARPFTSVADPMSGFFAFRRALLARAGPLSPVGYKIALELIVRSRARRVVEIPIHFTERTRGRSKLTWRVRGQYLRQLFLLALFRLRGARARSGDDPAVR